MSVLSAADVLCSELRGFDARLLSGADAELVASRLSAAAKACTAAATLAAARAVECGAHKGSGAKDGPAWWARQSGITAGQARQAFDTAQSLEQLPDTKAAVVAGEISLAQAGEIAHTEAETPGAERALLDTARRGDLGQLKEAARQHRQHHTPVEDLHRRQQAARYFSHWTDSLGMICFKGALPPETGLPLIRRVEVAAQRARRRATIAGQPPERFDAWRADGLAALVADSKAGASATHADLVIVCDLYAWRRGHTHPGEVCHLIAGGPIPVDLAHELGRDAFLKVVLHDGVNIAAISHLGRHIKAELRTALDLGPVPAFTGAACADCGCRWGLEYDHGDPVAHGGPTSYANLKPRCYDCHETKTETDRKAGLLGPFARAP